jgi:hypothetical protein
MIQLFAQINVEFEVLFHSVHPSIALFPFCWALASLFFSFVIFFYTGCRTHWTSDQPVGRPLLIWSSQGANIISDPMPYSLVKGYKLSGNLVPSSIWRQYVDMKWWHSFIRLQSPTTNSRCRINKGLIKRESIIDHWRWRCKGLILWPTPYKYIHLSDYKVWYSSREVSLQIHIFQTFVS